ncbi:hypothetical protein HYPSUDRAFT_697926 [Hypholoma sublateritium FD-334 SS-4]|uniref:Protein PBN1 n=1 Tax=Hypholoma sublateritium (strain FD-334 SS-4) TaxID=945553 RepID=A0A0D2Q9N3_HYPSF|nr:hypothetical protein HYPSUDRAFT_697926 [Hypholoma sublateritium FD-334 SS-4]
MHFLVLLIHFFFVPYALCNTEIINFSTQVATSVDHQFTQSWPTLCLGYSTLLWNATAAESSTLSPDLCPSLALWSPGNLHSCPYELWIVLDLDAVEWQHFDKFTLRLSWPAYYPAAISLSIFEPFAEHPPSAKSHHMRRKYARIHVAYTGVLTPGDLDGFNPISYHTVPISLTLEPLHLGFLPQSVIPIVWTIAAVIMLAYPAASKLANMLQNLVERARYKDSTTAKMN